MVFRQAVVVVVVVIAVAAVAPPLGALQLQLRVPNPPVAARPAQREDAARWTAVRGERGVAARVDGRRSDHCLPIFHSARNTLPRFENMYDLVIGMRLLPPPLGMSVGRGVVTRVWRTYYYLLLV